MPAPLTLPRLSWGDPHATTHALLVHGLGSNGALMWLYGVALADAGFETIMLNCNPETVSTDYDTSDRLYFEPLTLEDVLEVVHAESEAGPIAGVIVQLGGQTPLGLAKALKDEADGTKVIVTHSMCRKSQIIIFELVEALVCGRANCRRWAKPWRLSQCMALKNQ